MMLVLFTAACSGGHPALQDFRIAAPSTAPAGNNTTAFRNYATTVDGVSARIDKLSRELQKCASSTRRCRADAAASEIVAVQLLRQLNSDDEFRESGTNEPLPPGISPLVIKTERDVRTVIIAARSISAASGRVAIKALSRRLRGLDADVDAAQWR
jgi:hypothetical protein